MFLAIILGILFLMTLFIFWFGHRTMTIEFEGTEKWHYGTFPEFWKLFSERKWERDNTFRLSYFIPTKNIDYSLYKHNRNYIHAGIICFDSEGLVLYPWSYINFLIFTIRDKYKA